MDNTKGKHKVRRSRTRNSINRGGGRMSRRERSRLAARKRRNARRAYVIEMWRQHAEMVVPACRILHREIDALEAAAATRRHAERFHRGDLATVGDVMPENIAAVA